MRDRQPVFATTQPEYNGINHRKEVCNLGMKTYQLPRFMNEVTNFDDFDPNDLMVTLR